MVPPGWQFSPAVGSGPYAFTDDQGRVTEEPPSGTKAMCDILARSSPDLVGPPTHFVSFPWSLPFRDVADALQVALEIPEPGSKTPFLWLDVLCVPMADRARCRWDADFYQAVFVDGAKRLIGSCGQLMQVSGRWDDPERFKRMWMAWEALAAVDHGARITYAMPAAEQAAMADKLIADGPDAILAVVFELNLEVTTLSCSELRDQAMLAPRITEIANRHGGLDKVSMHVRELTRRAYAESLSQVLRRRMDSLVDVTPIDGELEVLCLGERLARLWSLTDDVDQAEKGFRVVLSRLRAIDKRVAGSNDAGQHLEKRKQIKAAEFQSICGLMRVLAKQGRAAESHDEERKADSSGELAVSWQGVSIEFLKSLVAAHEGEFSYLSTDAVVERVIKPTTRSRRMFEEPPRGHALIEAIDPKFCGRPRFFLSHAWRTTFHVPASDKWRGGLVQAVVDSEPEQRHSSTYFWFDIFCVNQHLLATAFAFEPLRNAIAECEHLKIYMETWHDPATLGRVWCLDELRVAMLLGKPVRVCMPQKAQQSFRDAATSDPLTTRADIERIVERISIEHAASTKPEDRSFVLDRVEATLGLSFLNLSCQSITRSALLEAAGIELTAEEKTADQLKWKDVFNETLSKAREENRPVPSRIEIQRAVAMMQRRIFPSAQYPAEHAEAQQLLTDSKMLAERFFGQRSEVASDIERQVRGHG